MLRVGVGQSSHSSPERAVRDAATQAMTGAGGTADAVLVFATVELLQSEREFLTNLRDIAKTDRIVGCSGMGVITGQGEIDAGPGVAVLALSSDTMATEPFLFHPLRDRDRQMGAWLAQSA